MGATHYALSEALIVGAAFWSARRFATASAWFGACGIAIFGVAALIGTYRFASGQMDQLALIHRSVSQVGGVTAIALIAVQFALQTIRQSLGKWLIFALALPASTLALCVYEPDWASALFAGWIIVAIVIAAMWPPSGAGSRVRRGIVVALMLGNIIVVRGSASLAPEVAWHLFHCFVAAWVVGLWWVYQDRLGQASDRASP